MLRKKIIPLCVSTITLICTTAALADNDNNASNFNNGIYVGAGAGYVFGSSKSNFGANPSTTVGSDGFAGQLLGGYNLLLTPQFYLGAEGFMGIYDVKTGGSVTSSTGKLALNYLWGAVAEPGYHFESANANIFARAGFAMGNMKMTNTASATHTFDNAALAFGAGSELELNSNLGVRGQYTFYDFTHETSISSTVRPFFGEFLLAMNYHF